MIRFLSFILGYLIKYKDVLSKTQKGVLTINVSWLAGMFIVSDSIFATSFAQL